MNKKIQNFMIFLSSLFPLFLLLSLCGNYKSKLSKLLFKLIFFGGTFHILLGSPIMRYYKFNLFSTSRNTLGFFFCSTGQILVLYFLYKIIDNDKKINKDSDDKLSQLQKKFLYISIFLILLNLLMRLYIIIEDKGEPLKNIKNIQTIFSHFGTKESDTKILCPFNLKNKNLCSYIITIIVGFIILFPMLKKNII